jgi:acyl dehydratase
MPVETAEEHAANRPLLNFERLERGAELGRATISVDDDKLTTWQALFPGGAEGGAVPPGLLAVLMMRAFGAEVSPRLPSYGVVGHNLRWAAQKVERGETLFVTFHCLDKQRRPEGCRVEVEAVMHTDAGALVFEGEVTLLRAA